jgi:predicted DNA-binding protein (MmcQ/YjbR family)
MNKKYWNTVMLNGSVPDKEIFSWIDHSYELITGKH